MRTILVLIGAIFMACSAMAQDDWMLPKHKGKIQFEFDSEKLNSGERDLCDFYLSENFMEDFYTQLYNAMNNGKSKFFSSTSFTLEPQLAGADYSDGSESSFDYTLCTPGNDTLIGSLNISIAQLKVTGILSAKLRTGSIKCLYRIILKDDSYNIKFRGFKYTFSTKPTLLKPSEVLTVPLEEEYDEINSTKSDKKFWADIKMCVNVFNSTLQDVLGTQGSDFDFDD